MRVHLIKKQTLEEFSKQYSSSKIPLEDWAEKIKFANWEEPIDMKATFNTVDLLGKGSKRVVFDIGGNSYRVICKYQFGNSQVHLFVCWIGTHAAYDKLCNHNKQYTINIY
ncbi:type II toxin-antitoxin system HigB family toxin [Pedobacter psychroterrae]|uniref:Type II toxin-antitoxin system HigB family toxin n=1 Tax=Pedobacter psychroterrae TaxID=2530453 RepID=A0A4R0NHY7_9SPHI|nr:type II toxin-antitoxin system HigB family toxin [Pedobacter psychroterrae]TCC98913.1 type II toxin-antitoxin system HigB family toxin [Pedobacter psychroterrae]